MSLNPYLKLLIPAAAVAFVLSAATIGGVFLLIPPRTQAPPAVDSERERQLAEDKRRLEKELADERAQVAKEKRKDYARLLADGKKCLAEKHYDEAIASYNGALSLYPGDADATNGLISAKAGEAGAAAVSEDRRKRTEDFEKVMAQGTQAMSEKQYAKAAQMFESALSILPGNESALTALTDAKLQLSKDEIEKKKLSDYQTFLDAGNTALNAARYADAIREFVAAQRIIPGDAAAARGQLEAEKQLAALQNAEMRKKEFTRLMEKAIDSMRARKFDDAIDNATAAQRIVPEEASPQKVIDDAKKAKADARLEYTRLMTAAQVAVNAKQYQQAQALYALALQVIPNDPVALQGQQAVQQLLGNAQNAQAGAQGAYAAFMTVGAQELQMRHFREAARAFTAALQQVPNDPAATQGLANAQQGIAAIVVNDVARTADFDRFMALATTAMTNKLYRDAVAAYKDALLIAPDNPLALAGLQQARYSRAMTDGEKAMLLKKYGDAVVFFKEALETVPGDLPAREQLKLARFQHGLQDGRVALKDKRYGDAVVLFEEALREKPADPVVRDLLHDAKYGRALNDGMAALNRRKFTDAIVFFQDALRERPNDPTALNLLNQAKRGRN